MGSHYERKIKLEEELDPGFLTEVSCVEGCENINRCIQCGTCSATCPLSIYMDIPPRKIIGMVKNGFRKEALSSMTIWLCASCYACSVLCPQDIGITDIMYSLKRIAMREKLYPKGFPLPILSREFFRMVLKRGRSSETWLIMRVWLRVSVARLLSMIPLGLTMFRKKRISLRRESIQNKKELSIILNNLQ